MAAFPLPTPEIHVWVAYLTARCNFACSRYCHTCCHPPCTACAKLGAVAAAGPANTWRVGGEAEDIEDG